MELSGVRLNSAQPWGIPWMAAGVMLSIRVIVCREFVGVDWSNLGGHCRG